MQGLCPTENMYVVTKIFIFSFLAQLSSGSSTLSKSLFSLVLQFNKNVIVCLLILFLSSITYFELIYESYFFHMSFFFIKLSHYSKIQTYSKNLATDSVHLPSDQCGRQKVWLTNYSNPF